MPTRTQTELLDPHFELGFQTDIPRELLPDGAAYRMRDWIPALEAPARKRGGFTHVSGALAAGARVPAVGWAPVVGDPHLLIVNDLGNVYSLTSFIGGTPVAATGSTSHTAITERPFWHKDRMILLQGLTQTGGAAQKYTGTATPYTVASLGGSPPQARVGASWGDYLMLANGHDGTADRRNRIWWGAPGNPESWSVGSGGSFFDMPEEVLKCVPLRNILLILGYSQMWMLTGDTPPPGGNLAQRDLFLEGTSDPRSVARWRDYVVWANNTGIWRTDGTTLTDITDQGGISLYWQKLVSQFSLQQGWSACAGVYRDQYIICVRDSGGATITTLCCDLNRYVWYEFTNFDAVMFAERSSGPGTALVAGGEEMFFGRYDQPHVGKMSSVWTPDGSNVADADSVDVLPMLETRFHKFGVTELKRIRRVYVTYDLRSSGQNAYLQPSFVLSPTDTSYVNADRNLPETTLMTRDRAGIARRTSGIGLKFVQVNPSSDTRLYTVEGEAHPLSETR